MHTAKVLHKLLVKSVPFIHSVRLTAFVAIVEALAHCSHATVTSLGRGILGKAYDKHKIKRVDRLLSNHHLFNESLSIYTALTQLLVKNLPKPVIIIDWSPLCADQSWQLLRAALPLGGRSLTLYEEVHPQSKLGNRKVQHRFLDTLARMLPDTTDPIIVADSGFRTPFFRHVESLNWHWLGRVCGRDFINVTPQEDQWVSVRSLHCKASTIAKLMGEVLWVKSHPLSALLVLVRKTKKHRRSVTLAGKRCRSSQSNTHSKRQKEPWVLVCSRSLKNYSAKKLVKLYRTRMQIEEGFRDCKSVHYGLGMSQNGKMSKQRRSILCLVAACAMFILWCIGTAKKNSPLAKQVKVNSSSKREPYSVIFLARLLLVQRNFRITGTELTNAIKRVANCHELLVS